jgi:hypothetical protein
MNAKTLISSCCFALTTLALPFAEIGRTAQEEILAFCETSSNTIRTYRMNNQVMMRVFDRRRNRVQFNASANRHPSLEGVNYVSNQGRERYQLFVANSPNRSCSFRVGNSPLQSGLASIQESSGAKTIARCQGNLNLIQMYTLDEKLRMRAVNRANNKTWLDTVARRNSTPQGINYSSLQDNQSVRLFVANDRNQLCTINVGNSPVELGRVLARSSGRTN